MPDPRQYVRPGQRLQIAASQINALNQMMRVDAGFRGGGASLEIGAHNFVHVLNSTDRPVPIFGVLSVGGIVIDPTGGEITGTDEPSRRAKEFARRPVVSGVVPSASDIAFVIALEPILQGKIGRAAVSGAVPCRVEILSHQHNYATVRDGDVTQLRSAECGPVQLLWKPPGGGLMSWALGVM